VVVIYGFLVVVAFGLVVLVIRSPVFRQFRRGHGAARPPFSNANDNAYDHNSHTPRVDPLGRPKPREWE
jgi:hypothetical protein